MPLNFDDNIFDILSSSMGEVFPELIAVFFQETESSLQTMKTDIASNNIKEVLDASHKLKSSAKTFGAFSFVEILENIENSEDLKNADLVTEHQKLKDEYVLIKKHILAKSVA